MIYPSKMPDMWVSLSRVRQPLPLMRAEEVYLFSVLGYVDSLVPIPASPSGAHAPAGILVTMADGNLPWEEHGRFHLYQGTVSSYFELELLRADVRFLRFLTEHDLELVYTGISSRPLTTTSYESGRCYTLELGFFRDEGLFFLRRHGGDTHFTLSPLMLRELLRGFQARFSSHWELLAAYGLQASK